MLHDDEVKVLLSKHLDIHYEALKENDEDWRKFKDQICFNAPEGSN
jgi:hypothetical protein